MRDWYKPLAITLGLALGLSLWQGFQAGNWSAIVFAASFLTLASALAFGSLFCRVAGLAPDHHVDILVAIGIGILIYEVSLLALAFLSPLPFYLNVCGLALLALASTALFGLRRDLPVISVSPTAVLAAVVCFLAAGFWSSENLRPLVIGNEEVIAHGWQDLFYHARLVAWFGHSQGAATLSDFQVRGQPAPIYHYGSYMIPASVLSFGGGTAYSLAASFIAPFGALLSGFAAYGFGKLVTGRETVGLLACSALLLIPDASYLGLGNRWTGYWFFQQVGVAGPYAVAAMGLGWALVLRGIASESWRTVLSGVVLCGLSLFFKAQIFVAYSVIPILFLFTFYPKLSVAARISLLAATFGAYLLALKLMAGIPGTPTVALSSSGFSVNLGAILDNFPPTFRLIATDYLLGTDPRAGRFLVLGVPMLLLACYGVSIIALGPLWWLARSRGLMSRELAWLPLWIILPHLVLALGTAPNAGAGDPFEVFHKTFVWPVWAITVWVGVILGLWLGDWLREKYSLATISAALVLGTLPILWYGGSVQSGISWSHAAMDLRMPRGLYDAALFVRNASLPNDVVQLSENDSHLMFPAFSERPFWAVRTAVNSGPPSAEFVGRFDQLTAMRQKNDIDAFLSGLRELGIRWWVFNGPAPDGWESRAVMSDSRGGAASVFKSR